MNDDHIRSGTQESPKRITRWQDLLIFLYTGAIAFLLLVAAGFVGVVAMLFVMGFAQ